MFMAARAFDGKIERAEHGAAKGYSLRSRGGDITGNRNRNSATRSRTGCAQQEVTRIRQSFPETWIWTETQAE